MMRLETLVEAVRREFAPEPRTAIFEIRVESRGAGFAITGVTTEPAAATALVVRAARLVPGSPVLDEVTRLPDPILADASWAVVRSGIAPVLAAPDIRATQTSQYVLGSRLQLLLPSGRWYRVRGEDGYIGWVNRGYIEAGNESWALGWEGDVGGEPFVSLGAELHDDGGAPLLHLPWGARIARDGAGRCLLPDRRAARLARGELVPAAELSARYPAEGEAILRSAARWIGTPYIWGGVTPAGVDCSGFVQAVLRLHGVHIPRDAELQLAAGTEVAPGRRFERLRAADLLFFTEVPGRITHVALSKGGPDIIHSALSNGGVATNCLTGTGDLQPALRRMFVTARRVLAH